MAMNWGAFMKGAAETGMTLDEQKRRDQLERDRMAQQNAQWEASNRRADEEAAAAKAERERIAGIRAARQQKMAGLTTVTDALGKLQTGGLDDQTTAAALSAYNNHVKDGWYASRAADGSGVTWHKGSPMSPAASFMTNDQFRAHAANPLVVQRMQDAVLSDLIASGDLEGAQALKLQMDQQWGRQKDTRTLDQGDRRLGQGDRELDLRGTQITNQYELGREQNRIGWANNGVNKQRADWDQASSNPINQLRLVQASGARLENLGRQSAMNQGPVAKAPAIETIENKDGSKSSVVWDGKRYIPAELYIAQGMAAALPQRGGDATGDKRERKVTTGAQTTTGQPLGARPAPDAYSAAARQSNAALVNHAGELVRRTWDAVPSPHYPDFMVPDVYRYGYDPMTGRIAYPDEG